MKKFIILVLCSISIVPIYFSICINKNDLDFPHFKQSNIKYNGTIYTHGENVAYLETLFIDENIASEMASNSNIKKINIIDKSGEKLELRDIQLGIGYEDENSLIRVLKSTIVLNENKPKNEYSLDKMIIKYIDGKEKIFNLGKLNINTTKIISQKLAYHSYQELVPTTMYDMAASGIIIKLGKMDYEKIKLKDIDLGLEGIEVDYKNIKILDEYDPDNQEDYDNASNIELAIDDGAKEKFNGIELEFGEDEMVTIVIPFKISSDFDKQNIIYMINPKLTLESNGVEEILFGDDEEKNNPNIDESELRTQLEMEGI